MKKQLTFERFETKYILSTEQYVELKRIIAVNLEPDLYPNSHIITIYYDTDDYRIIRSSIEAKDFKEKLRLRKYENGDTADALYLEIKRKCEGVVYKRRHQIIFNTESGVIERDDLGLSQIEREIDYVFATNPTLKPKVLISYDRLSYKGVCDEDFRVTLDANIRARFDDLANFGCRNGDYVLEPGYILMEVKSKLGYPNWFLKYLSNYNIMKQSFSKYGVAYQKQVLRGDNYYGY